MFFLVKKIWTIKFFRFLVVGLVNTLFGYSVFVSLLFLGLHYTLAVLIATILGILFNFKTISITVFNFHNNWLIINFFGVYSVVYAINILGLYLFGLAGINAYVAGAVLVLPMACIAFFLNKQFVFNS